MKHKFNCTDSSGKVDKNVRFREASFEFGEQIAVLGIVRNVTDERGEVRKVLFPVSQLGHIFRCQLLVPANLVL